MSKKRILAFLLGATIIAGIGFNAATTAKYIENLGEATQTINAATWDVKMGKAGAWEHTIFPGTVINEDIISLNNNNDYAVKFTIKLETKNNGLNEALTFDLKNEGESTGIVNQNGTVDIIVNARQEIKLNSYVKWESSETVDNDIEYQGNSTIYKYDITAEALVINNLDTYYSVINGNGVLCLNNFNNNSSYSTDAIKLSSSTENLTTLSTEEAVDYRYDGEANLVKLEYKEGALFATVNGVESRYDYDSSFQAINTALFLLDRGGKGPIRISNVKVNGAEFGGSLKNTNGEEMFFDVPVQYTDDGYIIEFNLYLDGKQGDYGQNEDGKVEVRVGTKN